MKNKRWKLLSLTALCMAAAFAAYSAFCLSAAPLPLEAQDEGARAAALGEAPQEAETPEGASPEDFAQEPQPESVSTAPDTTSSDIPAVDPQLPEKRQESEQTQQPVSRSVPEPVSDSQQESFSESEPPAGPSIPEGVEDGEPLQPESGSSTYSSAQEAPGAPRMAALSVANLSQLPDPGSYWYDDAAANEVMKYINSLRASLGLDPLIPDEKLIYAARIRNVEQRGRSISHTRPDGRDWSTVLTDDLAVLNYNEIAENLAWRTHGSGSAVSAYDLYQQWVNSPSHYEAMVNPDYTYFGLSVLTGPADSYTWNSYATTLFFVGH